MLAAIAFVVYLCILYFSAKAVSYAFTRFSRTYRTLSSANQQTSDIYVMNIVYTTVALGLQLAASPVLGEEYTLERMEYLYLAAAVISGLYIFELVYRDQMRWPMLTHHFSVSPIGLFCRPLGKSPDQFAFRRSLLSHS